MGAESAITYYGIPLSPVISFNYLDRVILAAKIDWPAVVRNLRKVRSKWAWMTRVLSREGAYA